MATAGLAEAAVPLIIEGAERVVKSLIMDLEQHVIGEVIEAPRSRCSRRSRTRWPGWTGSRSGSTEVGAATSVSLDSAALAQQVAVLREHAATIGEHGEQFARLVGGLQF